MSTTLETIKSTEAEPDGPTFRLSRDQFQRLTSEAILPGDVRVELRDGILYGADTPPTGPPLRLSVDQYEAMAEAGILDKDDRVELLEGWLVAKMGKNQPHVVSASLTFQALSALLPAGWFAAKEDPIKGFETVPEPDIMILRGSIREYRNRAPGAEDAPLVVEVADVSLRRDRGWKKRLYARSGFLIYWIINLVDLRIEVYTEPTRPAEEPDFLRRRDYHPGEMIPLIIEGREIGQLAVSELLP